MCGIVGIYLKTKKFEKNLGKMLSGMLNNMESRGPDSAGFAIYKNEKKDIFKYSLCLNDLNFKNFKKEISNKIKKIQLSQHADHVILKTPIEPKIVIKIINKKKVKILVKSQELEDKYGESPVFVSFDYGKKQIVFHKLFYTTNNMKKDMNF